MSDHDVLIVGAGLAGLGCALELHAAGVRPLLLEASDGVGSGDICEPTESPMPNPVSLQGPWTRLNVG